MDLIYCPFEKTCSVCDKLNAYEMTDENGRVFPLRRYNCTQCLFEVYNCADLITENNATGKLYDFTLLNNPNELLKFAESNQLKTKFNSYTKGHGFNPIL